MHPIILEDQMREKVNATEAMEVLIAGVDEPHNGNGAIEFPGQQRGGHTSPEVQNDRAFEPVLDSNEAAALLKIHPKTLQRLARAGRIPGFRIGKLWGFRASSLNRWLGKKLQL